MGYYAFVLPAYTGHLNPMLVLAGAVQARGHRVAMLSTANSEARVRKAGLEFLPIANAEFPDGEWERWTARAGALSGFKATTCATRTLGLFARGMFRDLPLLIARERFDGVVMDQIAIGAEAVCQVTRTPVAVACNALMLNPEWGVPPALCSWPAGNSFGARLRNAVAYVVVNSSGLPMVSEIMPYRFRHRLGQMMPWHANQLVPSLVQVAQQPAFFDFPRAYLPDHFHYTAPWVNPDVNEDASFPWSSLDGRPLVYASLGTLQNRMSHVFRAIAEACVGLPAQLVIALGHTPGVMPSDFPGSPIVVGYAPQRALLKRATLVITHAGLNTTLESLREGLPVVALPITNDQPGVAARIKHLGFGEFIPIRKLTVPRLHSTIRQVLSTSAYRDTARTLAKQILAIDGPAKGAELIEKAFVTRQRVIRC